MQPATAGVEFVGGSRAGRGRERPPGVVATSRRRGARPLGSRGDVAPPPHVKSSRAVATCAGSVLAADSPRSRRGAAASCRRTIAATRRGVRPPRLRDPILGNREAGNPPFDANTICAEVESGKRNGSTSVCDQPEMSLVTATYSQGSQDMIIVTFGKSCSEGPSCELPGTYVGDTLYTVLPDQVIGTWCGVGSGYTLEKTGIKGFDARTNKHGTVTLGTCDVDECVLGCCGNQRRVASPPRLQRGWFVGYGGG